MTRRDERRRAASGSRSARARRNGPTSPGARPPRWRLGTARARPPRARRASGRRRRARGACRRSPRPCPGSACPFRRRPRTGARAATPPASRATSAGSSPNERMPEGGIRRVRRDVEHRRVVDVDADRAQLQPDRPADPLREPRVARRADRHRAGERSSSTPPSPEGQELAALLVGRDEDREAVAPVSRPCRRLEPAREPADLARRTDVVRPEEGEARDRRGGQPGRGASREPSRRGRRASAGRGRRRTPGRWAHGTRLTARTARDSRAIVTAPHAPASEPAGRSWTRSGSRISAARAEAAR